MQNGINKRSGAHIAIENNTKIPSIVSKGLSVMPGTEANIGLTSKKILRLSTPYKSNCTNHFDSERVKNDTGNRFSYSSKICKGMCYGTAILDLCECLLPSLVEGFSIKRWFGLAYEVAKVCNITEGSKDFNCISTKVQDRVDEDNVCGCNPECYEGKYQVCFYVSNQHVFMIRYYRLNI